MNDHLEKLTDILASDSKRFPRESVLAVTDELRDYRDLTAIFGKILNTFFTKRFLLNQLEGEPSQKIIDSIDAWMNLQETLSDAKH